MKKNFNLPLINTHCHAAMVGFRGMGEGLSLHNWLNECIFPLEAKMVNPQFVYEQTKEAMIEMKENGIVAFMDMYYYEEEVARAAEEMQMHVVIGEGLVDVKGQEVFDNDLRNAENTIKKYQDSEYVSVSIAPHSPYTVKAENLIKAKAIAKKYDIIYQIHAAETKKEYDDLMNSQRLSPIEYLDSLGVLDEKTVLIHCVWLTDKDIGIIAERKCRVAHCPLSNLKLGSGIAPVAKLIEAGVMVSIGTDGAASSNRLDVWEAGKFASLLQKGINHNPELLTSKQIIEMMTLNGIFTLGLERKFNIEKIKETISQGQYDYLFNLQAKDLNFSRDC